MPEPLDPARPIDWVPVWSMTHDAWRYAPAAFTHLCYPEEGAPYCRGDSNGNAAGVTIEEAIIQGFLEVCERDSVALWWYGRIRRPGVDLASFPRHPYFTDLAAYYERVLSRRLHVLDLTSDLQIPTFVAVSHPADDGAGGVVLGFGAHFDAPSALYRALTELTQGLYSTGAMAADADGDPGADDRPEWLPVAAAREAYLFPDPERPLRTGADYGPAPKGDLRQAVNACVSRARAAGFEVCVANHTREHVGVPVVKVIVPGMLPWWRRLGLCRLYEAPVRMGWLVEGIGGGEVNPHSITM